MKRLCLERGCSLFATPRGSRCPYHARTRDALRQAKRGTIYQQGWAARSRAQRESTPYCEQCGRTTDLTADHLIPGDPSSPLRTLCRACNSARANRARAKRPQGVWGGGSRT